MPEVLDHALRWLRAYADRLSQLAARTWHWGSPMELLTLLTLLFWVVAELLGAVVADGSWWDVLFAALWLVIGGNIITGHAHERRNYARLLEMKPTGAPRMATVTCRRGRTHELLYGPEGWEQIK